MRTIISQKFIYGKLFCFIGLILYRVFLDVCYANIISPTWGYQGYFNNPSGLYNFISWVFLITLSPLIVKTFTKSNISSNIVSVLVLVSLVPTTSLIAFNSTYELQFVFLSYIYWALLLVFNLFIPSFIWNVKKDNNSSFLFTSIIVMLCATVIFISWKYTGFRLHFGLFDVYELRLEAREYDMPVIIGYLSSAANTILPIIFVYYLIKKKNTSAIIIAGIILLNFGIAGGKSVILLLFIAIIGYVLVKSLNKSRFFVWGMLFLIVLSFIEFKIFGTYFLSFFTTYRLLFLPSMANHVYYDFFSTREFDYFRQSIFKWFHFDSPYKDNIAFLIGYHQTGDFEGRANNGLFSDAYLNFGPIGMIIFPLILVIIFKFIEGSTKGFDERLLFIVTLCTAVNLLSLTFSTALLSGGLLLMIIFFYSIPRFNNKI